MLQDRLPLRGVPPAQDGTLVDALNTSFDALYTGVMAGLLQKVTIDVCGKKG